MNIWTPNLGEMGDNGVSSSESRAQVISGGQVGADIAGLRAAKACGLSTGGWMPKGYRTLFGPMDRALVEEFGMIEHEQPAYPPRTEQNVVHSDGTIRFAYDFSSPGEKCTLRFIKKHSRPYFDVVLVPQLLLIDPWDWYRMQAVKWIENEEIEILNVAGNGDTRIENVVERFLVSVFQTLARREENASQS